MTQTTAKQDPHGKRLWFSFLAGPVVYSLYFLVVYTLGEFGCLSGLQYVGLFGWSTIRLGVTVLTIVAALVTLGVGVVSFRKWRQIRQELEAHDEGYPQFMLFVGTWLNGFFTVIILLTGVPMLLGSYCEWI